MIQTIEARNVKGLDFDFTLTPLTMIVGRNFTGKTAVLDAIRLAILGYVPELGKTNKANFQLAGGGQTAMEAICSMSDGKQHARRFELLKGAVKSTGSDPVEMPLLVPEHYFTLSDKERREYVASRFGGGLDLSVDGIIAGLEQTSFGKEHSEDIEAAKKESIGNVRAIFKISPGDLTDALNYVIDGLKMRYTEANAKAKDSAGAVRTLSELKAQEQSFENIGALKEQIVAHQKLLAEANANHGNLAGMARSGRAVKDRRDLLEKELKKARPDYDAQIKRITVPSAQDVKALAANVEKLKAETSTFSLNYVRIKTEMDACDKDIFYAENQLEELEGLTCCPFCKSKGKGWADQLKEGFLASRKTAQDRLKDLKAKADAEQEEIKKHTIAAKEASDLHVHAVESNSKRDAMLREIEDLKRQKSEDDQTRKNRVRELAEIKDVEIPDDNAISVAAANVLKIKGDLSALNDKYTKALGIQNDIKRASEAALANKRHEAMKTVLKAFGQSLVALQEKAVGGVFVDMLKVANGIIDDILKSEIAYHEGEIGRWDGGRFISHMTFSGTEKTLCYAAIAAALSSKSPSKVMLLDELSRLTESMRDRLFVKLASAVKSGVLDQVVAVVPVDASMVTPPKGWSVISVGG